MQTHQVPSYLPETNLSWWAWTASWQQLEKLESFGFDQTEMLSIQRQNLTNLMAFRQSHHARVHNAQRHVRVLVHDFDGSAQVGLIACHVGVIARYKVFKKSANVPSAVVFRSQVINFSKNSLWHNQLEGFNNLVGGIVVSGVRIKKGQNTAGVSKNFQRSDQSNSSSRYGRSGTSLRTLPTDFGTLRFRVKYPCSIRNPSSASRSTVSVWLSSWSLRYASSAVSSRSSSSIMPVV